MDGWSIAQAGKAGDMAQATHEVMDTAARGAPGEATLEELREAMVEELRENSDVVLNDVSGNTPRDISLEISHPEYMYIGREDAGAETLYGCDQDWYRIEWRRRAGCGPVAATNILLYLKNKYGVGEIPYTGGNVAEALSSMNDAFTYVRPRRRGLNTVKKFVRGMCKFGRSYGVSIKYRYILIPPQKEKRPDLQEIVRFIRDGLSKDIPVAFLNLHAGAVEEQLSSWHWVTVVGMTKHAAECPDPGTGSPNSDIGPSVSDIGPSDTVFDTRNNVGNNETGAITAHSVTLRFFDQSKNLAVDLGKWLDTTANGGGFAYFYDPKPSPR
jgi:hypothetical protein